MQLWPNPVSLSHKSSFIEVTLKAHRHHSLWRKLPSPLALNARSLTLLLLLQYWGPGDKEDNPTLKFSCFVRLTFTLILILFIYFCERDFLNTVGHHLQQQKEKGQKILLDKNANSESRHQKAASACATLSEFSNAPFISVTGLIMRKLFKSDSFWGSFLKATHSEEALDTVPKAENKTCENGGKQKEQAVESSRKAYKNQLFCKFIFHYVWHSLGERALLHTCGLRQWSWKKIFKELQNTHTELYYTEKI